MTVPADSEERIDETLDASGLPRAYAAAVRGHRDALNVLRTPDRRWTCFSKTPRPTQSAEAWAGQGALVGQGSVAGSRWTEGAASGRASADSNLSMAFSSGVPGAAW